MKFKNKFAHKSNYGPTRPLSNIKYIVIHFTGNKGDTALNNCKYFQRANRHHQHIVLLMAVEQFINQYH